MADTAPSLDAPGPQRWTAREIRSILLMAGFMIGAMLLLHYSPWSRDLAADHLEDLRARLMAHGRWAWVIALAGGTAILSIGFPRLALSAVAGAVFGILPGILIAQTATTLAAIPPFLYIRWVGRETTLRRLPARLRRLDALLSEHGFMVMLLIRLCPVGNAFLTNCAAGVSSMRFGDYLLASFLGFIPETVIFAMLGAGFQADFNLRLGVSLGLFLIFSFGFAWYFKRSPFAAGIADILREGKQ